MNFSKYINIPYKNLGRDSDGLDCYGLVHLIFKTERGIVLPDYTELQYCKEWYKKGENHIIDHIDSQWKEVSFPYQLYDCFIFYMRNNIANHIGMYLEDDKFIHIMENHKSQIDRLNKLWRSKIYKAMRYIG